MKKHYAVKINLIVFIAAAVSLLAPILFNSHASAVAGSCGDNAVWNFDEEAFTLTISGTGEIKNYASAAAQPWSRNRDSILFVVIEEGITRIGKNSFNGASKLISVTFADSVTSIGEAAFSSCSALYNVKTGSGLTEIGASAFFSCTAMRSLLLNEGIKTIGTGAFSNCTSLQAIVLPDSLITLGRSAFSGCSAAGTPTFGANIETIGAYAFSGCTKFTPSVSIPKTVKIIGNYAFSGCTGIFILDIPEGVTEIGIGTFSGCTNISTMLFPESTDKIGGYAFYGCTKLNYVNFSSNLESIGECSFAGCTGLTAVVLPKTVSDIGYGAFYECNTLEKIIFNNAGTTIFDSADTVYFSTSAQKAVFYGWMESTAHDYADNYSRPFVAFDECTHDYELLEHVEPSCEVVGYDSYLCKTCGYIDIKRIGALGHDYQKDINASVDATCTEDGSRVMVCSRCSDRYTIKEDALGHNYIEGVTTPPSCMDTGLNTFNCSRCDSSYNIATEALGHNEVLSDSMAPTCLESGFDKYTCTRCSANRIVTLYALGHDSELLEEKAATCTEDGYKKYHCRRCSLNFTEILTALGHNYTAVATVEATCEERGYITYACSRCPDTYNDYTPALGHDYILIDELEPKCTTSGYETYKCNHCSDEKTDTLDSLGHDWVESSIVTSAICTQDGETAYYCSRNGCNASYDKIVTALGHDMGEYTVNLAATCIAKGTQTSKCTRCDFTETREIPMIAHSYIQVITSPTCTQAGYTTFTCSVCNDSYTDNRTEALGHSMGAYTVTRPATCTTKGTQTSKCTLCDFAETREISIIEHNYTQIVTLPTCTQAGYTTFTCSVCSNSYQGNSTEALGHDMGEYTVTLAATCTTKGTQTSKCTRCDFAETREISIIEHNYTQIVTSPTCTQAGYTTFTCSVCNDTYTDNRTEALGHNMGAYTVTLAATCTTKGTQTSKCTRCDFAETREISIIEHNYTQIVTSPTCTQAGYTTFTCSACSNSYQGNPTEALGHDMGEYTVTLAATCTVKGTKTSTCTRCDLTATRELSLIAHSYTQVVTSPTCTLAETTVYTCSICQYTYSENTASALGHDYTVTAEENATCTKGGYINRSCKRCKYAYTEYLSLLGHDYKEDITSATCTQAGFTLFTCSRCADSYTGNHITALGHDYKSEVFNPTCTKKGYTQHICTRCKDTYITDYINETGHSHKLSKTVPASCTKDGLNTFTCPACGDSYASLIPVLGHCLTVIKILKKATILKTGRMLCYCSRCNKDVETDISTLTTRMVTDKSTGIKLFYTDKSFAGENPGFTVTSAAESYSLLDNSYGKKAAYKTNEYIDGVITNPSDLVALSIPLPDKFDIDTTVVYTVGANDTLTEIDCIIRNNCFLFELYATDTYIVVDTKTVFIPIALKQNSIITCNPEEKTITVPDKMTAALLLDEFMRSDTLCVADCNNNTVDSNTFVGTGYAVQLRSDDDYIYDWYTVIVSGDLDSDGEITAYDARLALRYAVGLEYGWKYVFTVAADADGDDAIVSHDARLILRYCVGLEPTLPIKYN